MGHDALVEIEGKTLKLTNLDKVFYPQAGWTKAHVIDYYRRIAPVLLPHLKGRAVTLKRYPDGVEGEFFYEKECPSSHPDWVKTAPVWSESRDKVINYCVLDTLPSLMWAANMADLEIHTYLATGEKPLEPTSVVFDLDPGAPATALECAQVGLWLRDALAKHDLQSFIKTSGSKGLQLYVPLNKKGVTFEDTKTFARALAETVERDHPAMVTTTMSKAKRPGKVFIDFFQNDDHKTTVCVYSLRAKEAPTVSTPLDWSEVEKAVKTKEPMLLSFTANDVLARVEQKGDMFAPVLALRQTLPAD